MEFCLYFKYLIIKKQKQMALKNAEVNLNYVRLANGKFYLSNDKEKANPYTELEGLITALEFKLEEYNGKKTRKLVVRIADGDDIYLVTFPFDSTYTSSFISFLKNADVTKPLSLVPLFREEKNGEKESRSLLIKQGGKFAKSYYSKANPNGLPEFKKIKRNGNIEWDRTDFLEFIENVITDDIIPQLVQVDSSVSVKEDRDGAKTTAKSTEGLKQQKAVSTVDDDDEEYSDDLPF